MRSLREDIDLTRAVLCGTLRVMDLSQIATDIVGESEVAAESYYHGERHWMDVARYGIKLAKESDGDPVVAFLFGLLHDSQRRNEDSDPEHGPRAADYALSLAQRELRELTPLQVDELVYALDYHDTGLTTVNPTIGACWDADRVTLWRVKTVPDRRFMSTRAAYARPCMARHDIFRKTTWEEIAASV